jgi:hypothetical protein
MGLDSRRTRRVSFGLPNKGGALRMEEDQVKEIPWERQGKMGIILLVIAVVLPLLVFPFVSGYEKGKGFKENIYRIGIQLREDEEIEAGKSADSFMAAKTASQPPFYVKLIPKRIPFRFFLVISVILTYMGIIRIDNARRRRNETGQERGDASG